MSSNEQNNTNHINREFSRDDDHFRTVHNRHVKLSTSSFNKKSNTEHIDEDDDDADIDVNIFRFKFTTGFTDELYKFSKIHQYDHRKDFKTAWDVWVEDHEHLIKEEESRLTTLGYNGDVLDKMFKSARYYFRKKSTEVKKPKERRAYVGVQKELLELMDEHISECIKRKEYKPSFGFLQFCKLHGEQLKVEIEALNKHGITHKDDIQDKIKKTYKNRYFTIITK